MEPIVIKLTVPLTHGAETITELRIPKPTPPIDRWATTPGVCNSPMPYIE